MPYDFVPDGFAFGYFQMTNADGHICQSTFGLNILGDMTAQEIADQIRDDVHDDLIDYLVDESTFDGVFIFKQGAVAPTEAFAVSGDSGTETGSVAPPNVQNLLQKKTGIAGRGHSGRMYFPDVLIGQIKANGDLTDPGISRLATLRDAVTTALFTPDEYEQALLHADGSTPDVIVLLDSSNTVATQRRRLER